MGKGAGDRPSCSSDIPKIMNQRAIGIARLKPLNLINCDSESGAKFMVRAEQVIEIGHMS